ncbi:unnamed protein product [Arctogadus glacialis]
MSSEDDDALSLPPLKAQFSWSPTSARHLASSRDRRPPSRVITGSAVCSGCLLPAVSTAMDQQIRCCNESVRFEFLSRQRVEPTDARSHGAKGAEPGAGNGREVDLSHFSPRENHLLIGRYMLSCVL